jgi:hypothetical protein
MKINIIHHDRSNSVMVDAEVLTYLFKRFKNKPKIEHINIGNYTCPEATINIFLESINYSFIRRAKYNILIPNQHYFHKNWLEYLPSIDLVLCKTKYCFDTFKDYVPKEKIDYISWRSPDISINTEKDDDAGWMLMYTDHTYMDAQKLIDLWQLEYPTLNIMFSGVPRNALKKRNLANIMYIENLTPQKFEVLFNQCAIHICLEQIDNYNHNVNQCQLTGSIPVAICKGPILEAIDIDNSFCISSTKMKIKNYLGSKYRYSAEDLKETIEKVLGTSDATLEIMGRNCKEYAHKNQQIFNHKFTELFSDIFKRTSGLKFNLTEYKNDDLPSVSIITLYNSTQKMFKLPILNYTSADYPKDLIEWIIVANVPAESDADAETGIESLLPPPEFRAKFKIKYIECDPDMSEGARRNLAIEAAENYVILNMDDDYFFYQPGFRNIVMELMRSDKSCIGCSTIGAFHITRFISIIATVGMNEMYSNRVYPGTLCFYRDFWQNGQFGDDDSSGIAPFLKHRMSKYCESSWEDKYVALIYSGNEHLKQVPDNQQPNGCHYKFSKKVFEFVTGLDTTSATASAVEAVEASAPAAASADPASAPAAETAIKVI